MRIVLSRTQAGLVLAWLALCAVLAYSQLGYYISLFIASYALRYFPVLGALT